jgi:hypothetical protein
MGEREVSAKLESKLVGLEAWVAAIRKTDTDGADAAAVQGLALCTSDGDPFYGLFSWLRHISGRLWIRDETTSGVVTCSFCGANSDASDVEKFVAGPAVFICGACVALAARAALPATLPVPGTCGFCSNREPEVYRHGGAVICPACVATCIDIISESKGTPSWE